MKAIESLLKVEIDLDNYSVTYQTEGDVLLDITDLYSIAEDCIQPLTDDWEAYTFEHIKTKN